MDTGGGGATDGPQRQTNTKNKTRVSVLGLDLLGSSGPAPEQTQLVPWSCPVVSGRQAGPTSTSAGSELLSDPGGLDLNALHSPGGHTQPCPR